MGDIHIMKDKETTGHMSGQQILDKSGKSPDAIRKKLVRLSEKYPDVFPDASWNIDRMFNPDQVRMIVGRVSGRRPAKKTKPVSTAPPTSPDKATPAPAGSFPKFGLTDFLSVAIYGHTALVWYEVSAIFAVPGFLAGVILFAMKHTVTTLVKDAERNSLHGDALGVAFVLDGLAMYAHYTVFVDSLPDRFAGQMGEAGVFWASIVLAAVVATGAFMALYFIKSITNSKMFQQ